MKFNIFIVTEGDSNPDDETVYGIKSTGLKGVFVAEMPHQKWCSKSFN
jgi:hypothetical protein